MGRKSTIEALLEQQHGDLEAVIPPLVSKLGQADAAQKLGVRQSWISRWLSNNGYVAVTQYVKRDEMEKSA